MTNIYPYAVLAEDPTSEAVVCWVDDRDGADGSSQTLDYDGGSESVSGDGVPESDGDAYLYEAEITGLSPDTEYGGTIDGELDVSWRTLPDTLDSGEELTIVATSDLHVDQDYGMDDPDDFAPLVEQDSDVLLIAGDMVTWGDEQDETATNEWLRFWREYIAQFNEDARLVPMLTVPGNHEVGNHTWRGDPDDESVDPEAGYFQFWFRNPPELEPSGENYGSVTIGGYLQILALDTHSAFPEDVEAWLADEIDETVDNVLPIHHSPLVGSGNRSSADWDLQPLLMGKWGKLFSDTENVEATICGHLHVRKRGSGYSVVENEPDGFAKSVSNGNWLQVDPDGVVEYGEGWAGDRSPRQREFVDGKAVGDYEPTSNQFYRIKVGNPTLTVAELDSDGNEIPEKQTTPRPGAVLRDGAIIRGIQQ